MSRHPASRAANNRRPKDALDALRLFAALRPPAECLNALKNIQHDLKDLPAIRLPQKANLHVTAHFIGTVAAEELNDIRSSIASVTKGTFSFLLQPDGTHGIPGRASKMIWARYRPSPVFTLLTEELADALNPWTASNASSHDPVPHITLARFRSPYKGPLPDPLPSFPPFRVDAVELWSSTQTSQSSEYQCLDQWPLADSDPLFSQ